MGQDQSTWYCMLTSTVAIWSCADRKLLHLALEMLLYHKNRKDALRLTQNPIDTITILSTMQQMIQCLSFRHTAFTLKVFTEHVLHIPLFYNFQLGVGLPQLLWQVIIHFPEQPQDPGPSQSLTWHTHWICAWAQS